MPNIVMLIACGPQLEGSEAFPVADTILLHASGTETEEGTGNYVRSFTGDWLILAWGAEDCPGYKEPEQVQDTDDRSLCEKLQERQEGLNVSAGSPESRYSLSVNLRDAAAPSSIVFIQECGPPDPSLDYTVSQGFSLTQTLTDPLDFFEVERSSDRASVSGEMGDKLKFDWTLPVCDL